MLKLNFLTSFRYWGMALDKIEHEMPHKHDDFRKSMNPNTMDAAVWLIEELVKQLDPEKEYNIIVLNSWLGFPLVPLICENIVKHELSHAL